MSNAPRPRRRTTSAMRARSANVDATSLRALVVVAATRLGDDQFRRHVIALDLAPKIRNVHADVVSRILRGALPYFFAQRCVRHCAARVRDERDEQIPLRPRELDQLVGLAIVPPHRAARQIDRQMTDVFRSRFGAVRASTRASELHAQASPKLLGAEWLRDVIIGTGVEQPNLVAVTMTSGEHNDRSRRPAPNLSADVQPFGVGKPKI